MKLKTFGEFIVYHRKESKMIALELAKALDVTPSHISDLEKNRRYPTDDTLRKISKIFRLSEHDASQMYDLAAKAKNSVSADLPKYIMKNELVRVALRTAQKNKISNEKWEEFIKNIEEEKLK